MSLTDTKWPGRRDSNPQPSVPKTDALSIELRPGEKALYHPGFSNRGIAWDRTSWRVDISNAARRI
jgi:hypothetical protein